MHNNNIIMKGRGGLLVVIVVSILSLLLSTSVVHSQTTPTTSPTITNNGSQEWYVLSPTTKQCVQDCPTSSSSGPYCGGLSTWQITYPTLSECCINALSQIVPGLCETNSQNLNTYGGSLKYYPDDSGSSSDKKCVQDCELGSDLKCGGIIEYVGMYTLYDSVEECCSNYFTSLDTDYCVDNSSECSFIYLALGDVWDLFCIGHCLFPTCSF